MADVALTIALAGLAGGLAGVQADLGKLTSVFQGMGAQAETASAKLKTMSAATGKVGQELSLLMVPAALIGGTMIKAGADFERSMKSVEITTHASAAEMARASEITRQLGTDTTFSANEAADALNVLLRNGVQLTDALDGTLAATVQLAAATGTDLATAADIVSSAMQAYSIDAADAGKVTDVLYNAAIQSKFGVTDFGTALGYAQRQGLALGISFDDLATGISTTSFLFNEASTAGTGMVAFLTRIQPQSKEAENAMRQLGLITADGTNKFIDAQGRFIGFGEAATLLRDKLGGLTDAQKSQALMTIFQDQGMTVANALMIKGADAVDQNKAAIDRWGTTTEAATKMMDNFWGAIDRLGGAVGDVGIALTASGFIGGLTWLINNLANLIGWFADMPPILLNILAAVTGLAVAMGPLLLAFSGITKLGALMIDSLLGVRGAMVAVGIAMSPLLGPIAALAAGVTLLTGVFLYFQDDILSAFHASLMRVFPVIQQLGSWISWLAGLMGITLPASVQAAAADVGKWIMELGTHVAAVPDDIQQHMAGVQGSLVNPFAKAVPVATQHIENLGKSTGDMAAKAETAFNQAGAAATKMADEQIKAITATEAPLEDQVLALARLGKTLEGLGKEGADGVEKVNKAISSGIAAKAATELDFIMNRTNITVEEQSRRVGALGQDFEKYGKLGKEGQDKIFDAAVQLNREVARNEISRITDDGTRTLREQATALEGLVRRYDAMGQGATDAAKMAQAALEDVNQSLREQDDVMLGIETGLVRNIDSWGGWGQQAGKVVDDFTTAATDGLTTFFMTGEISTEAFTASFLGYIAQMAAETIVHYGLMAIEALFFGETSFASSILAATGFDIAAFSAWLLDAALAPLLIAVIAIAAVFAILYFAGVDIGAIFEFIAGILQYALNPAFFIILDVVKVLIGFFGELVNILSTFVGWIKTIGEELGKGDLMDLLDIFGGGGLGGGIGKIFGGIGDFFGGLFATGGWVGGSSGAVPIVAHAGEFVVNADSAARHAGLLEMINGGSDMHARVQTLGDFTGATVRDGGGSAGGPAGGGGNGGITVHMHGSVISDGLSTSQVGRTLGRSIRKETKRLLGG